MDFKELLENDLDKTFFNLSEFAEKIMFDTKEIKGIFSEVKSSDKVFKKGKEKNVGLNLSMKKISVMETELGYIPRSGSQVKVNKLKYYIEDVESKNGLLSIYLRRVGE